VKLALPEIHTAADLVPALGAIASAVAAGDLSPDEAHAIAVVLELQRQAIETADHGRRIAELEAGRIGR
jgi:hypothetical protein